MPKVLVVRIRDVVLNPPLELPITLRGKGSRHWRCVRNTFCAGCNEPIAGLEYYIRDKWFNYCLSCAELDRISESEFFDRGM